MKWPALLVFCLSAVAQTPGQNGLRVGGGTVFLAEQAQGESLEEYVARAGREGRAASVATLAAAGLTFDGSRIVIPPSQPAPRADFDTWVEGIDRQYAESITTGSQVERKTEKQADKIVIQRSVRDNFRRLYIRYSVTLEMLPKAENAAGTYRATFGDSDAAIPKGIDADWKVVAPPEYPVAQIARDSDTIPLPLYINQARGQRLIEYIHLGQQPPVMRKDPPRDVYTDAPEFDISEPKFRLNGIEQVLTAPSDPSHGASLWIYVPDQGRFDLSFKPAPDFELVGEAWGNSLIFAIDRNLLRLEGAERIAAAGSAPYRIYVREDTAWLPEEKDRSRVVLGVMP
ncbi:MAG TPA: hypothetical protein VIY49_05450 [Bryobacteraceae bacterium]